MEDYEDYIPFEERGNGNLWKDIIPIDEFSNEVNILKIDYSDKLREINDYFRAILSKGEISKRAYDLTNEVIEVKQKKFFC